MIKGSKYSLKKIKLLLSAERSLQVELPARPFCKKTTCHPFPLKRLHSLYTHSIFPFSCQTTGMLHPSIREYLFQKGKKESACSLLSKKKSMPHTEFLPK